MLLASGAPGCHSFPGRTSHLFRTSDATQVSEEAPDRAETLEAPAPCLQVPTPLH